MVNYYHIGLRYSPNFGNENKSIMGYNYQEKFLKNSIVKPCLNGKEFSIIGKWINPQRDIIREVQVFKTLEKITEFKIPIIDNIVAGEGISNETMAVSGIEHELVTDLFITSKPPTPPEIKKAEKHGQTNQQVNNLSTTYEQLDNNEQIALEMAIVYPHKSYSTVLPGFYEKGFSTGTLYRYHSEGVKKLQAKGFLDGQVRPTKKAFDSLPNVILKNMTSQLLFHLTQLKEENDRVETINYTINDELNKTKKHVEELETSLINATQQLKGFNESRIRQIIKTFEFLGIDDNWISVSVPLNLVEIAMKKKLETFGVKPKREFNDLLMQVRQEIRNHENREFDISLGAFHNAGDLYSFRCKIDHWSLTNKVDNKEADFIIEQAFKFIEALRLQG